MRAVKRIEDDWLTWLAATNEIGLPSEKAQMVFVAVAAWFGKSAEWVDPMLLVLEGTDQRGFFAYLRLRR